MIIKNQTLQISEGDALTFQVLEWFHEGWEFGRPILMLSPVIRIEHDHSAESLIESVCLDAVCDGKLPWIKECDRREIEWRGWNLTTLRRRFREVLKGKRFPVAGYVATTETVRIVRGAHGHLAWDNQPDKPGLRYRSRTSPSTH